MAQLLRDRGHGDLVFPLPTEWLQELGWMDGRLLNVTRLPGGRLVISDDGVGGTAVPVNLELTASTPSEHVFRRLLSAYLSGADEVVVGSTSGITGEQVAVVREFCRRITDVQVTFETKERLVLRGVPERQWSDPQALIASMARRVVRLHRNAGRSWDRAQVRPGATPYGVLDEEVDREAWLMERTLVRELALGLYTDRDRIDAATGICYLMAAKTLERIADHAVRIGEEGSALAEGPPELRASLATFHEQVMQLLVVAVDLLEHPEQDAANALIDGANRLLSGREAFGRTTLPFSMGWASRGSLVVSTNLVLESLRRSTSYVADLGEIALDLLAHR